ncbi:MAG: hypothetical protein JRG91_02390 [Deltaproteobacteria bacterium]|nr:hypothetical protein [Deltaproteobacteria bacterium]
MFSLIRAIIIALAMLTAMVLVFLGIRELRTGRGRHGLFVTTLLAALAITGCSTHTKVRSAADSPDVGTEQAVTIDAPVTSGRMAELAKTPPWADFKALWIKLDRVRPTKEGEEAFAGEYYGSITYEGAQGLREELVAAIDGLRKPGTKKLVGSLELELLETICQKRINYLEYGFQSMMTRMMPPPMSTDLEASIRDLERHIDVLVELRESGKLSSDEFQTALAIVEDDVKAYSVLDVLSESYLGYYVLPFHTILAERAEAGLSVSMAESVIAAFEKDYAAFQEKAGTAQQGADTSKEIAAQYEKAKEAIDELKLVLPFLSELVSDLES